MEVAEIILVVNVGLMGASAIASSLLMAIFRGISEKEKTLKKGEKTVMRKFRIQCVFYSFSGSLAIFDLAAVVSETLNQLTLTPWYIIITEISLVLFFLGTYVIADVLDWVGEVLKGS